MNKDNHLSESKTKTRQFILVAISCMLSIVSLFAAIKIINTSSKLYLGSGGSDGLLIIVVGSILLFSAVFTVNLLIVIKLYQSYKKNSQLNLVIISTLSLFLSMQCFVAIPLSMYNAQTNTNNADATRRKNELNEEHQKNVINTVPATKHVMNYKECFKYSKDTDYREARDAVCSYIRYMYSNNWQEVESSAQMLHSKYFPNYFYKMSQHSDEGTITYPSILVIDSDSELISRENLRDSSVQDMFFAITPHLTCSKEENKSVISIWYIGQNDDFTCLYYDYHIDAKTIDLEQYENTDYDALSPELKDFYKTLFDKVHKYTLDDLDYRFIVPYQSQREGAFLYDNMEFVKQFFAE